MRCFLGPFADPQSHVKIQMGKLHAPDMALSSVTVSQSTGVYFTLVGNNVWQSMYELSCFGGEEEARKKAKEGQRADIEHTLETQENTTNDGNQTEETTNSFSAAVDAQMIVRTADNPLRANTRRCRTSTRRSFLHRQRQPTHPCNPFLHPRPILLPTPRFVGESSTHFNPNVQVSLEIAQQQLEGLQQQIAALEATLGTTSNTSAPMYFENSVTPFPTLSSSYVTNTVAQSIAYHFSGDKLNGNNYFSWWVNEDGQRPIPSLMEVCYEICLEEDCTSAMNISTIPSIDSAAFSARSSTSGNDKHNGKPISVCEHCQKNNGIPKNSIGSYMVVPQEIDRGLATLGAIVQSDIPQSFDLISVDGKNPWILDSGATDHLTGSSVHFVSYIPCDGNETFRIANGSLAPIAGKGKISPCAELFLNNVLHDLSSGKMIGTARHSKGLYLLNNDTSSSSTSRTSLLSSYFTTSEQDYHPSFPVSHLQRESESEESNSNRVIFLESTSAILVTIPSSDPHYTVLPTNQVPWKIYYRRNLRKEVGSPTKPLAPVQDSEPPRDQGMKNSTESCTNNMMNENDRSNVVVLENVKEKNSGNETGVRTGTSNNEAEQGHTGKLDEYDPSLDIPIALRKIQNFYNKPHSTIIPKSIYTALECPEWKNAVMEEMKALERK
ncbi:putative mitochondrial protein [Cucumis melo var. makuwa]|uniref:Putative mitochondrial protein n=1 Tax=Cucumis melo var. makuwa TaxID=1194695 RepID=A0A5D3D316_CUCMM|nr:putative mitochondrial protein [Cucumis melo var. makuwa]